MLEPPCVFIANYTDAAHDSQHSKLLLLLRAVGVSEFDDKVPSLQVAQLVAHFAIEPDGERFKLKDE